jgi:2-oxoglutarate ferredoxin oxidoreductase subunit alpha
VQEVRRSHRNISFTHLRYIHPLPANLGDLIGKFNQVLIPEMNMGQLSTLLRDKLGIDPTPLCKVTGQPFLIAELTEQIRSMLPPVVQAVDDSVAKGMAS